ncbi:hypothetical protein Ddc_18295 [Ditylenchus destructor]|nr:hypothetical protein Ddc_18295 [Ditylenchus destructor]
MSNSKPLPSFTYDLLCYLNREQLERFSIVCRFMKNFIDRYFWSKPYRVFDKLHIRGGLYVLEHNNVRWHPNRDDYSVQQFLAGQKYIDTSNFDAYAYCSFAKMRSYLNPTIRIKLTFIYVAEEIMNNPEHIVEMESIAYLWRNANISIFCNHSKMLNSSGPIHKAQDMLPILNSPTILQCRYLKMYNPYFSFKDYKVLYTLNIIETWYGFPDAPNNWTQFLEQPGIKPILVLRNAHPKIITNMLDHLFKVFSSAVLPNAFKVLFTYCDKSLIEFRETNKTSGEKLELKKGIPVEYQHDINTTSNTYTLERSSI